MKRVRSGEESEELEWAGESERPHSELRRIMEIL